MQYVRTAVEQPPEERHPMHQFAIDHGDYRAYWLLHWQYGSDGWITTLFYVSGPVEPYVEALAARTSEATHSVTEASGEGFYLYARSRLEGAERRFVGALDSAGILIVPPVEYRMDGSLVVSLVGPQAELAATVETLSEEVDATLLELGPYEQQTFDAMGELTERQREVVGAAVALGYYSEPREATVADVAEATDCAASTAAEHLRKAEAAVMDRAATSPVASTVGESLASAVDDTSSP